MFVAELDLPTPCTGWRVSDLLEHITTEHTAISGQPEAFSVNIRHRFDIVTDRWLDFFADADRLAHVPKVNANVPARTVLSTHTVDMILHTWGLRAALGVPYRVDQGLLARIEPVVAMLTSPGSPFVGPGRSHQPALAPEPAATPLQNLVRRIGRDHSFRSFPPA
jgi:uncharacterized protein (TIGR03086 family)